jgi:hypothetical protein
MHTIQRTRCYIRSDEGGTGRRSYMGRWVLIGIWWWCNADGGLPAVGDGLDSVLNWKRSQQV